MKTALFSLDRNFHIICVLKKVRVPFRGPLLLYIISYMYTKIPLSLFVIKKEKEVKEDVVYNIQFFRLIGLQK